VTGPALARPSLHGPVLVVGAGLMGTSVGLALRRRGVPVLLDDADPRIARVAVSVGAGDTPNSQSAPQLVVVAVPPDHLGGSVVDALRRWPDAAVTDVGSVKVKPLTEVLAAGVATQRYVGGHPMAGSERSGPLAATADLFEGRSWAVTPHEHSDPRAVALVEELVQVCGASLVRLSPAEHDLAVARISHLPHLLSVLAAAQLTDASPGVMALTGQGLRDVTRVASGDPRMWRQILSANAEAVAGLLQAVREDLDRLLESLHGGADDADGLVDLLTRGVSGARAIPGKHGQPSTRAATLFLLIPDEPGALARLFAAASEVSVNIEDVRIDHDPARPVGLLELSVAEDGADRLVEALNSRGWTVHR